MAEPQPHFAVMYPQPRSQLDRRKEGWHISYPVLNAEECPSSAWKGAQQVDHGTSGCVSCDSSDCLIFQVASAYGSQGQAGYAGQQSARPAAAAAPQGYGRQAAAATGKHFLQNGCSGLSSILERHSSAKFPYV